MFPVHFRPVAALVLFSLLASRPTIAFADEDTKKVYQHALRATAFVVTPEVGTGTGWVVDRANRLLVTNHHVVEHQAEVLVLFPIFKDGKLVVEKSAYKDERGLRGRVVDTDVARDLAVIQLRDPLPEGATEIKLAADSAEPTDRVHSIGNPSASGALWVYTFGTVRAVYHRTWNSLGTDGRTIAKRNSQVMETQSPLNPGDSGGPVVNDKGELVAVVSSGKEKHGDRAVHLMNWCIDVAEVRAFVEQSRRLLNPRSAADFNLRGLRSYERGRYTDAIADLTEAIKLNKRLGAAYHNRGLAFFGKGDLDTAIADLTKAIELEADDAVTWQNRGRAHARKGETDKAVADYTKAIQLNPKYALAYNNRGVIYHERNDLARALADYSQALEHDAENAITWQNRGKIHHSRGNYDQAIGDCTNALKLNASLTHAWELRGWSLLGKKEYDRAILNFNEAIQLNPNAASLYLYRGNALTWKNEWDLAIANYTLALKHNAGLADAYYWRAWALEKTDRIVEAQPDYRKAIDLKSENAKEVKTFHSRYLKIVNERDEPIRVYLQYEYQTKEGKWVWWPDQPGGQKNRYYDLAPGKSTYLLDEDWKVKARRVRIWSTGLKSGQTSTEDKGQDRWLCLPSGYLARFESTFTYAFAK